jgi:mRNA-degrading endonuclease toxin of MazEF toxin-antitoxin module
VARRGEVLVARRRLGFGAEGKREHFVVVQSDLLAGMETVLVAPLDEDAPIYKGDPFAIPCSGREAGSRGPHVVLTHLLSSVLAGRFDAAPAGRLLARTMTRVDDALRLALDL